jgi:hypothetical protein
VTRHLCVLHLPNASDGRTGITKSAKREVVSMCDEESLHLFATKKKLTFEDCYGDCQLERTVRRSLNRFTGLFQGPLFGNAAMLFILTSYLVPILCALPVPDYMCQPISNYPSKNILPQHRHGRSTARENVSNVATVITSQGPGPEVP